MRKQKPDSNRIIIGLTGSFGSGKTTVARSFSTLGAKVIDADKIAHSLIIPRGAVYKKIVSVFGKDILDKNKRIDRVKLGRIVFFDKKLLFKLSRIIHPEVIKIIKNKIRDSKSRLIVLDVPLLIESGLNKIADKVIVVKAMRYKQIERIKNKTHLSKAEILKRIKNQMPLRQKEHFADFIIDNNGSIKETEKQVRKILRRLLWRN
jgi:dephospho-CoA kinase